MNPKDTLPQKNLSGTATLSELIEELADVAAKGSNSQIRRKEISKGEVLFRQGEPGDFAYLLSAGMLGVRVTKPDGSEIEIDKIASGSLVGEMAVLKGEHRSATVYAIIDSALISLDRVKLEQLVEESGTRLIDTKLEESRTQRLQIVEILGDLLTENNAASIHALQARLDWLYLSDDDMLCEQGEAPDGIYILLEGKLKSVISSSSDENRVAGFLYPGTVFGIYGMLVNEPKPASLIAAELTEVVRIPPDLVNELIKSNREFMAKLTRRLINQQQDALLLARI
jgi:CRP-like cAMP-binding protein